MTKLPMMRTADPQPFTVPSVGELSEVHEKEDEGKERGYSNDPDVEAAYKLENTN